MDEWEIGFDVALWVGVSWRWVDFTYINGCIELST